MLDKLYQNVGKLLQGLAKGMFVIETIGSIIAGLVMIFNGEDEAIAIGWCLLLFGWIVAFLSSLTLYGFGVLVENAEINIKKNETSKNPPPERNNPAPKSEPSCQPTHAPTNTTTAPNFSTSHLIDDVAEYISSNIKIECPHCKKTNLYSTAELRKKKCICSCGQNLTDLIIEAQSQQLAENTPAPNYLAKCPKCKRTFSFSKKEKESGNCICSCGYDLTNYI